MMIEITVVIIKNYSVLLSLLYSMEINSINKVIIWQKERERERNVFLFYFILTWFMSVKTCKGKVRIISLFNHLKTPEY